MTENGREMWAYMGTYTRNEVRAAGPSDGIYLYRFDVQSGALTSVGVTPNVDNPSFLAVHPGGRFLYAVNEVTDYEGEDSGALTSFEIDQESGELRPLNQRATRGTLPCHVAVDRTGRFVLATNYGSGSVCVFPLNPDGSLSTMADFVQHEGSSVNPQRQEGPHAHSVTLDPGNRYAFVADLGLDKVMIYEFDATTGALEPNPNQPWVRTKSGAGPRHFDFHPSGRFAYLVNEIDSTLTAFEYDGENGTLRELQTVPVAPEDFSGRNSCADVHVHPSGRFLFASNRGHDSIATFAINANEGTVKLVGHESTQGKIPRNFAVDPTGVFLLAANQMTDSVIVFRIDQKSGALEPADRSAQVPWPVCVRLIPRG